jgi:hypothetical protein
LAQAYAQNKDPKYKGLLDKFCGDSPDFWRLFRPYDDPGIGSDQPKVSPQPAALH